MTPKTVCIAAVYGVLAGLLCITAVAATPQTGPVLEQYGPVYAVPDNGFDLQSGVDYRVSMDVSATMPDPDMLNRHLESAARFLNMQARSKTAAGNITLAIVVHGKAAQDLLTDSAYDARFQRVNPNTGLLTALASAGVKVYLCGQTAARNKFEAQDLHPGVTMALSAMTAHVRLQTEGYTLIPF
jgi:intracellular sulfur oxidation DsrE/DsrF family protein